MAVYTFETKMVIDTGDFDPNIEEYGDTIDLSQPRDYASVTPFFDLGRAVVGELIPTFISDTELAGILFVSDSDPEERIRYFDLLEAHAVTNPRIPIMSFNTHIIGAQRLDSESPFNATHVVSDGRPTEEFALAQKAFNEAMKFRFIEDCRLSIEDVYAIAALVIKQRIL